MFDRLFNHGNVTESPAQMRARMVEEQLHSRGIRDERLLAAMAKVPREEFIASEDAANAYGDFPPADWRGPDHFPALHCRHHGRGVGV